jgi:acetoin utilization deacetylase AcuC-like enzyme
VALLDVDYHAGNGSLSIFYHNPRVFFASIHMDPELDYPNNCGYADQTGTGAGKGFSLNVPLTGGTGWNQPGKKTGIGSQAQSKSANGFGSLSYCEALELCCKRIKAFGACALVVSLGVDTLDGDPECVPLGGMCLHAPDDYTAMGELIKSIGIPVVYVQEGGYTIDHTQHESRQVVENAVSAVLCGE